MSNDGGSAGTGALPTPLMILLFVLLMVGIVTRTRVRADMISHTVLILYVPIIILSFISSLFHPFGSLSMYLTIIYPLLGFIYLSDNSFVMQRPRFVDILFLLAFILLIITYIQTYSYTALNSFADFTVMSSAYIILYMLPFLLCSRSIVIRIAAMVMTALVVASSVKRGCALAFVAALLVYLFIKFVAGGTRKVGRRVLSFCIVITLVGISAFVLVSESSIDFSFWEERLTDESDDGGSGRLFIYKTTLQMISDSNPVQLLVGHGWDSVRRDAPYKLSAHNDFLEVAYDFGLIIFILYVLLYVRLIKLIRLLVRNKSRLAAPLGASTVLFFIGSMLSHILIYPNHFMQFCMFWGYVILLKDQEKLKEPGDDSGAASSDVQLEI